MCNSREIEVKENESEAALKGNQIISLASSQDQASVIASFHLVLDLSSSYRNTMSENNGGGERNYLSLLFSSPCGSPCAPKLVFEQLILNKSAKAIQWRIDNTNI